MVFRTVQGGDGPDVVPLDDGGAPDALQLQKQVIGPGVAVADGGAVCKQAVGNVAEGIVPGLVVVDAVVADPAVVDPGLFQLRHIRTENSLVPEPVVDGDSGLHGGGAVLLGPPSRPGGGKAQSRQTRAPGAVDLVIALLTVVLHHGQGLVHKLPGLRLGEAGEVEYQLVAALG